MIRQAAQLKLQSFRNRAAEVGWNRGLECHLFVRAGMPKTKFPRVKHLAREIAGVFAAIKFIAEDGMTQVMEVDANLVGAAAVKGAFN
jgi:hypothetical protein